jgi:hypothetical protein
MFFFVKKSPNDHKNGTNNPPINFIQLIQLLFCPNGKIFPNLVTLTFYERLTLVERVPTMRPGLGEFSNNRKPQVQTDPSKVQMKQKCSRSLYFTSALWSRTNIFRFWAREKFWGLDRGRFLRPPSPLPAAAGWSRSPTERPASTSKQGYYVLMSEVLSCRMQSCRKCRNVWKRHIAER